MCPTYPTNHTHTHPKQVLECPRPRTGCAESLADGFVCHLVALLEGRGVVGSSRYASLVRVWVWVGADPLVHPPLNQTTQQ